MNNGPSKHLTFGGSNAYRWLRCPGSAKLCATLPPAPENEYMAEGTRAHALLELAVRERRDTVKDFEGQSLQPGWPAYDAGSIEAVQTALDYINDLLSANPDHDLYVEQHVTLLDDVGGTVDVMIYLPSLRRLHAIDYKHGRGKWVDVDNNPQLKLYATSALFNLPGVDVSTIHATIIQPRCQVGEPVRTAVYGPADLLNFSDEVDEAVRLARADNPPLIPGEEQCHWCPAAHVCPALVKEGTATVTLPPEGADRLPTGEQIKLILPEASELRNPAVLAFALQSAQLMKIWIKGVEDAAYAVAMSGAELPGFKLVPKRAFRRWQDEVAAANWFASETLLDPDQYAPRKLLSVAQAEPVMKAAEGKEGVKRMAALVIKESSGLNLVTEDAPGIAVNPLQLLAESCAPPDA